MKLCYVIFFMARMRLVFWLEGENEWVLERSEEVRVNKILEVLPKYTDWTPIWQLAKEIGETPSTTSNTAMKILAAKYIQKEDNQITTTHTAPIINLRKGRYNKKRNPTKIHYLRAPIYIKCPDNPTTNSV